MMKRVFILTVVLIFLNGCDSPVVNENHIDNGNWWPLELDNEWNYSTTNGVSNRNHVVKIIGNTNYLDMDYFVLNNKIYNGVTLEENYDFYIKRNSQKVYSYVINIEKSDLLKMADLIYENPILSSNLLMINPIKDGIELNESWSGTVQYKYSTIEEDNILLNVQYTYLYEEHLDVMNVNGISYEDICKIKTTFTINDENSIGYVYYAKDIGPIKSVGNSMGSPSSSLITSYQLN